MIFNKDRIHVKHILEMDKDMEGWPKPNDILYFVCKRAADKGKTGDVTFSDYIIQKKMESASAETIQSSLLELIDAGYIEMTKESDTKTSYKVLINPYINKEDDE